MENKDVGSNIHAKKGIYGFRGKDCNQSTEDQRTNCGGERLIYLDLLIETDMSK